MHTVVQLGISILIEQEKLVLGSFTYSTEHKYPLHLLAKLSWLTPVL